MNASMKSAALMPPLFCFASELIESRMPVSAAITASDSPLPLGSRLLPPATEASFARSMVSSWSGLSGLGGFVVGFVVGFDMGGVLRGLRRRRATARPMPRGPLNDPSHIGRLARDAPQRLVNLKRQRSLENWGPTPVSKKPGYEHSF